LAAGINFKYQNDGIKFQFENCCRESIAVEAAKRTYVNGLEPPKIPEGEMEERKKSTVKFNDEPEVIPSDEVARL